MAFNFSEDEIRNMYGVYQNTLQSIQEQTKKVAEQIATKAKELRYYPVIEVSRDAVEYYNEELKNTVLKAMQTWQESEASFSKIMEKMSAGEDAKNRSKELETKIVDEIESWGSIDDSGLNSIDTTNWQCKVEDFQDIKEMISDFTETMDELLASNARDLENKKDENTIYVSIEPVVLQTISIVNEGFKTGIDESFTTLSQEFANKESEAQSIAANAAQSVSSKAQSLVSSGTSALKAKVRKILE